MNTEERLAVAIQALQDVCSPTDSILRELKAGEKVDGLILMQWLYDPFTYKKIAADALHKIEAAIDPTTTGQKGKVRI